MSETAEELVAELLTGAVEELDLPESLERSAHALYDDVGGFLSEEFDVGTDWRIYPQGSMRLGTVVRPSISDEYDIDSVACLDIAKESITQAELKKTVGQALGSYLESSAPRNGDFPTKLSEGRRCWTLKFDVPMHMDVLPAIADQDALPTGILITDRDLFRWQFSNPIAYSDWFFGRMYSEFLEARKALAVTASVQVDEIPEWQVRTMLQRAVQVLKLHRNYFFADDLEGRPASILVTTLAALTYRGGRDLYQTLMDAATDMSTHIQRRGGRYFVPNPVQSEENFADRLDEVSAVKLFSWLDDLKETLESVSTKPLGVDAVVASLAPKFGGGAMRKSALRAAERRKALRESGLLAVTSSGALSQGSGVKVRNHTFDGD